MNLILIAQRTDPPMFVMLPNQLSCSRHSERMFSFFLFLSSFQRLLFFYYSLSRSFLVANSCFMFMRVEWICGCIRWPRVWVCNTIEKATWLRRSKNKSSYRSPRVTLTQSTESRSFCCGAKRKGNDTRLAKKNEWNWIVHRSRLILYIMYMRISIEQK